MKTNTKAPAIIQFTQLIIFLILTVIIIAISVVYLNFYFTEPPDLMKTRHDLFALIAGVALLSITVHLVGKTAFDAAATFILKLWNNKDAQPKAAPKNK